MPDDTRLIAGKEFTLTEITATKLEAQEAAHDYAHEGLYFRIIQEGDEFLVYTAPGRRNSLTCCSSQRTYVTELP